MYMLALYVCNHLSRPKMPTTSIIYCTCLAISKNYLKLYCMVLLSRTSQCIMNFNVLVQYRPNVSYHLSSRFSRDASRFSRYESRFSRESLNRLVWNILLARGCCTIYCIRDFRLHCVVKSVKSKLKQKVRLFSASSY